MRIVIVYPQAGRIIRKDTDGTLYNLQGYVDGYIEPCAPAELRERGIEMLANEEGLLQGLPYNENLYPFFFVGTLVILGVDGEEFAGLTEDQETFVLEWLDKLKTL